MPFNTQGSNAGDAFMQALAGGGQPTSQVPLQAPAQIQVLPPAQPPLQATQTQGQQPNQMEAIMQMLQDPVAAEALALKLAQNMAPISEEMFK